MRKHLLQSISKFLIIISIFFIIATLFIVMFSFDTNFDNNSNTEKGITIIDKATIEYSDGTSKEVNLPITIYDEKELTAKFEIPDDVKVEGKCINTSRYYNNFEIFMGKQLISRYKAKDTLSFKSGFCTPEMINVPDDLDDFSVLSIHYFSVLKRVNRITINKFYIGDKSKIIMYRLYSSGFLELAMNMFFLPVFIIITYLTIISAKSNFSNKYILYLDIICLSFIIYFLSYSWTINYIFYSGIFLFHILEYSSLILVPMFILLVFKDNLDIRFNKVFQFLPLLIFFNFLIQVVLIIVTDYEFADFKTIDQLLGIIVITLVFIAYFSSDKNLYSNKRRLMMPFFPLVIILFIVFILDNFTRIENSFHLFYIGIMLFYAIECYYLVQEYQKLTVENKELIAYEKISLMDVMTGLKNRTAFIQYLNDLDNNKHAMWIIVIDINNLKIINDTKGHEAGDQLIKSIANIILLVKSKFKGIHSFRMGGDEFLLFVNGDFHSDLKDILQVFDDEKAKYNSVPENTKLYFSLGYSYFDPEKSASLESSIMIADDNMYDDKAKQNNS